MQFASSLEEPLTGPASVDDSIPTPESVIGHVMGDGAVRYESMVRYLRALDEASPLVSLTPYAHTHEGRPLYYLTITSPQNHAKLAAIQADNAKLSDPRQLGSMEEGTKIVNSLPGIAWLAYAIHGDELSSTDAAVQIAYYLAAGTDENTERLRDELVIHIDPLMNPDGRERYLSQLEHLQGRIPNADYQAMQHAGLWSAGRGNHYLFDLNRDWLMQVHPETQGRAREFLKWHPHLLVDSHEMGPLETYLFDPPREPFNVDLSPGNLTWRRKFSADQARSFDRYGWSYYTQDWYEEWYPGYTNAWANLLGAVGILYEQAGVDGTMVRQAAGTTLTYRRAVHHHIVGTLANLESLRVNRRELLRDYFQDRQWAVGLGQNQNANGNSAFLVPIPASVDRSRVNRFVELLQRQGIEVSISTQPVQAKKVTSLWGETSEESVFPPGTLVVRSRQPHRRLLHAILSFDPHMPESFLKEERKELENRRSSRIYDITAWNLGMAYGLEASWAGQVNDAASAPFVPLAPASKVSSGGTVGYGYLISAQDGDIYRAIGRLMDHGCKVRSGSEPFRVGGWDYPRGTALMRVAENPPHLGSLVSDLTADLSVDVREVDTALSESGPDLGTNGKFVLLQQPRVAIASQWPISTTSFGWNWHVLDVRAEIRSSPVNVVAIPEMDLRKYNVLILPSSDSNEGLAGVLTESARRKLRTWVEAGGTLIAIGDSAAFVAGKDRGLSAVRLREEVLDQLPVYEEALKWERAARSIKVDPAQIWGTAPPAPATPAAAGGPQDKATHTPNPGGEAKPDIEALKRIDERLRSFMPTGAIVRAELDGDHWLTIGLADTSALGVSDLPVLLSGPHAFLSTYPVTTPVRLTSESVPTNGTSAGRQFRLSGLLWPEARERWRDTAYATVERVGQGQIILFASDPFFRGYFEGSGRLLLNAIVLGPGFGTSAPIPW
ncbi:MAG: M14 family metallopeptidase [Planctomycetota bacterium]